MMSSKMPGMKNNAFSGMESVLWDNHFDIMVLSGVEGLI